MRSQTLPLGCLVNRAGLRLRRCLGWTRFVAQRRLITAPGTGDGSGDRGSGIGATVGRIGFLVTKAGNGTALVGPGFATKVQGSRCRALDASRGHCLVNRN